VLWSERVPARQWIEWSEPSVGFEWAQPNLWIVLLAAWSSVTALWSPVPILSVGAASFLIFVALETEIIVASSRHAPLPLVEHCALGLVAGGLVVFGFLAWEALTDQSLSRWVFSHVPMLREPVGKHVFLRDGRVVHISEASANRRDLIAALLVVPFVAYVARAPRNWGWSLAAAATALLCGIIFLFTESLSSQLALLFAVLTWGLAQIRLRLVRPALSVLWTCAVLLPVPIALGLFAAHVQDASLLPKSAQERVVIWSVYAKNVMQRPLSGIGADATPALQEAFQSLQFPHRTSRSPPSPARPHAYATHSHNVYLQVWYELGAPGALLLLGFGLSLLYAIGRMREELQPYAFAQFSMVATLVAFSYGIWQHWFLSAIAFGAAALLLVDVVLMRREAGRHSRVEENGKRTSTAGARPAMNGRVGHPGA
jgi:hypothetical protein